MSETSKVLLKDPALDPAQDYAALRREGISFIEQMGSRWWTDYNHHDPGITILEAVAYAITDLSYRIGWKIEDLLAPKAAPTPSEPPYPGQAFFTAREILTTNPVTPDDFRRLLIDLEQVRNAWLLCKECVCEASYHAWCEDGDLVLSYLPPQNSALEPVKVSPRGLYEALLELDPDPELGDLNDRKIESRTVFHDAEGAHTTILELRFPDLSASNLPAWRLFLNSDADFADPSGFEIELTRFGATKTFDVFTELASDAARDAYLQTHYKTIFYASFEVELVASGETIVIENAALRLFGDNAAKAGSTMAGLRALLEDKQATGFIPRYRQKAKASREAVKSAKRALHSHRNLDEDYCLIDTIAVEDVAVCADVEVTPAADIEEVQAKIWFAIDQYLNPAIRFHTLEELRDAGEAVEDIFDGPELESGFIRTGELRESRLRSVLRTSDIINRLMDIDGVVAVNQLLLTKYDAEGNVVHGAADPSWTNGNPVFDAKRASASWLLFLSPRHLPRLYLNQSRFLFFKNGLPFLPRLDEAVDTLQQLRGIAERPKNQSAPRDLAIPKGTYRDKSDYFPVQYSLPQTYGVGPVGLPANVPVKRRAQAKQLKGYLAFYEQVFGNALAQLEHTAELFSLDASVTQSYFVRLFDDASIQGFGTIASPQMTQAALQALVETSEQFFQRRNRFLDHLLARFGEDFSEHALLLTDAAGKRVAEGRLIESKTAFLQRYPSVSHDRGKAFDYTEAPCSGANQPGIKKRITLLLGSPGLGFVASSGPPVAGQYPVDFVLRDANQRTWLEGTISIAAPSSASAERIAYRTLLGRMVSSDSYDIVDASGHFNIELHGAGGVLLGQVPEPFAAASEAAAMRDQLISWASNERLIVVEHLLLRPKFPGDALYPACSSGGCATCGDEDPYSFRLTFVMPGWLAQYTYNLDLRGFATRTIQQETPSHLLGKVCWVGNDGFRENPCDEIVSTVAELLIERGLTADGVRPTQEQACDCANAIYHAFSTVFSDWYQDKTLDFLHEEAASAQLTTEFQTSIDPTALSCATELAPLWDDMLALMVTHFVGHAVHGLSFERFEDAWCRWLDANAAIDWGEERLLTRVQALLRTNLLTPNVDDAELCQCAESILAEYGSAFYAWMQSNIVAGNAIEALTPFVPPSVTLCSGLSFQPGTKQAVAIFLHERYAEYEEVSYRLWVVVSLLIELSSTYPGATLHDCDDGSDQNPVRLDNTALGNYPLRETLPEN